MALLQIEKLFKSFDDNVVLDDINLSIKKGEFISLLGYSGCGKSTLLRIIAGLEKCNSGKILYKHNDITKTKASKRKFAMVFQSYALFPHMSAYENLAFPLKEQGYSKKKIKQIVGESFELVGLVGNEKKLPRELSGGQQQRVAIARALSLKPKVLLLDEPLSALDKKVRQKLRSDIKTIHKNLGITSIMVTHDQEEAISMSDRIAVMNQGKIIQIDTPQEIYTNPKDLFTANFIGETNTLYIDNNLVLMRPEYIKITKDTSGNLAVVKDIEFLGSFFKITLDCHNKKMADSVISNVSLRDFSELELKVGDTISYHIKPEHMMHYKSRCE